MAQIEFPILVPDDVPLMDNTQLINYVVEHTCDEMRSVMIDLVYNSQRPPTKVAGLQERARS